MPQLPKRPLGLRILNGVGWVLRSARVPAVDLRRETLLARASRATGLDDFGDEAFLDPLARLIDSLEGEARLNLLGRIIARNDLQRLLENRLRMTSVRKRNLAIADIAIERPLFVLGLPRTGTTILHQLLAEDPANRVVMTWETMHPWPPPQRRTFATDPRIAEVDRHYARVEQLVPGFQAMHPMGATLPQECVALTAHDFASLVFHSTYDVPSYQRWLDAADLRPVYESHRRQLQYLQWHCSAERWVLKSPGHLWALDALLSVYPDACIVQTHRDPLKVVASLASLLTLLRHMASDHVDTNAIARGWTAMLAEGLERTMRVRDGAALPPERVFDVSFRDFMRGEVAMVQRIYDHFGMVFSADAEDRMRRFLAANPRDKHGTHRYSLGDAGLVEAAERRRFAAYVERFAVAEEPCEEPC